MYKCLIYTCIYTKVFEVNQEDMRHLRLSFGIVWQWKNIGLSGRLTIYKVIVKRSGPVDRILVCRNNWNFCAYFLTALNHFIELYTVQLLWKW